MGVPYGTLLSNIVDPNFHKKLRMLLGSFENASVHHSEHLGIKQSALRITHDCRLMALIDGGSVWSERAGRLLLLPESSIHLTFSDRDLRPDTAEIWLVYARDRVPYHTALARASSLRGAVRHDAWRPFQDPFAVTVDARALDDWGLQQELVSLPAKSYVEFELRWVAGLGLRREAHPLFGAPPGSDPPGERRCLFLVPEDFDAQLYADLENALSASSGGLLDACLRSSAAHQVDSLAELWSTLHEAAFIVADITAHDPMVFYGLGLAHGAGLHTILMMRSGTPVPFDINRSIPIEYDELRADLREMPGALNQAFAAVNAMRTRPSRWRTLPTPQFLRDPRLAFVLMPFTRPWSERVWTQLIRPAFEGSRFRCQRADEWNAPEVLKDIWEGICSAEVIVADLTDRNPNVLYELGLVHSVRQDFVLLAQGLQHVPSSLRRYRIQLYDAESDFTRLERERLIAASRQFRAR